VKANARLALVRLADRAGRHRGLLRAAGVLLAAGAVSVVVIGAVTIGAVTIVVVVVVTVVKVTLIVTGPQTIMPGSVFVAVSSPHWAAPPA
jgi:hypothetical protein